MEFYSATVKRPIRLSKNTRQFAYDSLNHKYGLDSKKVAAIHLDDIKDFETLTPLEKYNISIREIAKKAPIRICEHEKISGAATLGDAIYHRVPVLYHQQMVFESVSHLTIDFETVLKKGINGIEKDVKESLEKYKGTSKEDFLKSCQHCIQSFKIWHKRYLKALKDKKGYEQNYINLLQVPFKKAKNFHEAVQSIWFTFAFVRLCGYWPGIGRIDYLLGNYLKQDLKEGILTLKQAREILAHFFIKGCEWICGGDYGSGDAQHYQNIVLSGVDENGNIIDNEVTYLVLDILEEFNIGDFPTTVRISQKTSQKLLKKVAKVMAYGGGVLAIYNEEKVIQAFLEAGYELKEARNFANDGCWEVQVPGKTYFIYMPFDALRILQVNTLNNYDGNVNFSSFDELFAKFIQDLDHFVSYDAKNAIFAMFKDEDKTKTIWKSRVPCSVISLFEQGCVQKGLSYLEGGPIYNLQSLHIGGIIDVVNSLYVIKKVVYDDKIMTLPAFLSVLDKDWENQEELRQYVIQRYPLFGNDNDEADNIYKNIVDAFASMCQQLNHQCGYTFPAGISTFGRQIEWANSRLATPFGRKKGMILSGNTSPTPGSDKEGVTSIIKSYCKAHHEKLASGSALDIKLLPSVVNQPNGLTAIVSLIKGFVQLGGFFMQLDVSDANILKQAQAHPEDYATLCVRVSGWNARFVTLNQQWQEMIINQIEGK